MRGLEIAAAQRRMEAECAHLGLLSAQYKAVPPHYYSLTLQQVCHFFFVWTFRFFACGALMSVGRV